MWLSLKTVTHAANDGHEQIVVCVEQRYMIFVFIQEMVGLHLAISTKLRAINLAIDVLMYFSDCPKVI